MSFGDMQKEKDAFDHPSVKSALNVAESVRAVEIKILEQKLKNAEKVINFYADDMHWRGGADDGFWSIIDSTDISINHFADEQHCGGKMAREYQKKNKE